MSTMPPPGTPGPWGTLQYEFTPEQNEVMVALAKRMRLVGVVLEIFGVLGILAGLGTVGHKAFGGIGPIVQGIINLLLGIYLVRSAKSFRTISTSQGQDVSHLMDALRQLGKFFGLLYVLILIGVIVLLVSLITMVFILLQLPAPVGR